MNSTLFYLCPRCFEPDDDPTPCPRCGGQRVTCRPGATGDPSRRPLTSSVGEISNPAPVWWLRATGMADSRPGNHVVMN